MPSTPTNGKICYIEMPALDIRRSADFYAKVFGWKACWSISWSTARRRPSMSSPLREARWSSRSARTHPRSRRDSGIRRET